MQLLRLGRERSGRGKHPFLVEYAVEPRAIGGVRLPRVRIELRVLTPPRHAARDRERFERGLLTWLGLARRLEGARFRDAEVDHVEPVRRRIARRLAADRAVTTARIERF